MFSVFQGIVNDINRRYVYRTDQDLYRRKEHWDDLKEINGRLYGDCEDYCITIANRAIEAGVPLEDLRLHLVAMGGKPDHIVLEYDGWFADCNTTGLIRRLPYRKVSFRQLDQPQWQSAASL